MYTDLNSIWSLIYVTPPTVTVGTYTYNGNSQGPTIRHNQTNWSSYYSVSGNTTASAAGSYSFKFILKDKTACRWTDYTTADKSYSYTIKKSQYAVNLNLRQGGETYIKVTYTDTSGTTQTTDYRNTYTSSTDFTRSLIIKPGSTVYIYTFGDAGSGSCNYDQFSYYYSEQVNGRNNYSNYSCPNTGVYYYMTTDPELAGGTTSGPRDTYGHYVYGRKIPITPTDDINMTGNVFSGVSTRNNYASLSVNISY